MGGPVSPEILGAQKMFKLEPSDPAERLSLLPEDVPEPLHQFALATPVATPVRVSG